MNLLEMSLTDTVDYVDCLFKEGSYECGLFRKAYLDAAASRAKLPRTAYVKHYTSAARNKLAKNIVMNRKDLRRKNISTLTPELHDRCATSIRQLGNDLGSNEGMLAALEQTKTSHLIRSKFE